MKVYRVENFMKKGCYHGIESYKWRIRSHDTKKHPTPEKCKVLSEVDNLDDYIFGFKDLTQLSNWFTTKEVNNLLDLGFTIREYKVKKKDIIFATKQVIFKKEYQNA